MRISTGLVRNLGLNADRNLVHSGKLSTFFTAQVAKQTVPVRAFSMGRNIRIPSLEEINTSLRTSALKMAEKGEYEVAGKLLETIDEETTAMRKTPSGRVRTGEELSSALFTKAMEEAKKRNHWAAGKLLFSSKGC